MTLPILDADAAAMGAAYVLEGKTLGSRFLLEEARTKLGLDAGTGAAFFGGYGERTGAMWRGFREDLERLVGRNGGRGAVLAAAHATFRASERTVRPAPGPGDDRD